MGNIFNYRDEIVETYKSYFSGFLNISDQRVVDFVQSSLLEEGHLWPDPLVQLNLSYKRADTVEKLCEQRLLHPLCSRIFVTSKRESFHLFSHQQKAILTALRKEHFVVTSGTGSGKTLTYFIPIFDAVLKETSPSPKVKAIIVYPMNALVNSQYEALTELAQRYRDSTGHEMPVKFEKYTGQESREKKEKIQKNPPHILLTNYVMLELMMLRPQERNFVDRAATGLEFLVLDELHTYRGRQGADVSLLIRRLREKCGNPELVCIGTSATMMSDKDLTEEERRKTVAEVAGRTFGVSVKPENVIEEELMPIFGNEFKFDAEELKKAFQTDIPETKEEFFRYPLAAWAEKTFGIEKNRAGSYVRKSPITIAEGAKRLSEVSGLGIDKCETHLKALFLKGTAIKSVDGGPLFAFKLHQFFSQGKSVYATLESKENRRFSLEGEYYIGDGKDRKVLFPLGFCRICGEDYYEVVLDVEKKKVTPWSQWEEESAQENMMAGYCVLARENEDWSPEYIPPEWYDNRGRVKKDYRPHVPREMWINPNGDVKDGPAEGYVKVWFQPRPFLLCLSCGEFYTRRDKNDFRKLAHLSSEGRSSATTILCTSAIQRATEEGIPKTAQKILSFTDNRQDASLQAGHFNDFVQVSLLRSALYDTLTKDRELFHHDIAYKVVKSMGVSLKDVANNPDLDPDSEMGKRVLNTFMELIEYRIYEDLRRGWRVVQPNLEQCGLMKIKYLGMERLIKENELWKNIPAFQALPDHRKELILQTFMDHLRKKLAIKTDCLDEIKNQQLMKKVSQDLSEKWRLEEERGLRISQKFQLPGEKADRYWPKLSSRSLIGRFLRRELDLSAQEYDAFIHQFVNVLSSQGFLLKGNERGVNFVQLPASLLIWTLGDGTPPPPDPIYSRSVDAQIYVERERKANQFFVDFYKASAKDLKGMEGREHTAQISYEKREERENRFRHGTLKCLFCSPTMELGIDISDLQVVHMRNIPPTPANYAQRSGRAGRKGDPALVLAYSLANSGHDQYFFKEREQMVAGSVQAPRIDLGNEELIKAHVHAIWLSKVGLSLGRSISEILDIELSGYPIKVEIARQLQLKGHRLEACILEVKNVLKSCRPDITDQVWFREEWVDETIVQAPDEFNKAFNRWRELYQAAMAQLSEAMQLMMKSTDRDTQERANRAIREANFQRNLLLNQGTSKEESDFYPYRYLASEGFLPGYNFPRLPVRAYVPKDEGEYLSRPRFLAVSEYGPHNIIYHEGAKYEVRGVIMPPGGLEQRLARAKICKTCGFFHDRVDLDTCENCKTTLNAANSEIVHVLEMPNVRTHRRERITSDEEERVRYGYQIVTHYRFAPAPGGKQRVEKALVQQEGGAPLFKLIYAPSASLYRLNHGWKRGKSKGFLLNFKTGSWEKSAVDYENNFAVHEAKDVRPVRLIVRDTQNILLFYPQIPEWREDPALFVSLQYALQRGMEITYQVEESELASEVIGEGEHQAILLWEAAEGGVGILKRLMDDRDAMAKVAAEALQRCHFDPDTLEDFKAEKCPCACYECLLSYTNQFHHSLLDRHLIKDALSQLSKSVVQPIVEGRSYEEHYKWLRSLTDSRSELERKFVDHLYKTKRRLPDDAQKMLEDVYSIPDFFYDPYTCVFCDGSVHDTPEQREKDKKIRNQLKDKGYRVIVIRYDQDMEEQISQHPDVFGEAKK